jgi:FkbM family methyltransferase
MPSQLGQDRFVLELLGGMRNGFFLDSGAADGVNVSNTLLLETAYGWNGICIEPNAALFAALVKNRKCICVNCCLYDREGAVEFVEAGFLGGIRSEYDPRLLAQVRKLHGYREQAALPSVPKPARMIRSILREAGAPRVIDYWSLDTEGSEFTILKSFPFDEYSFRVLTVEHNRLPVREEIRLLLEAHGYFRVRSFDIDDGYVKGRAPGPAAWRSRAWSRRAGLARS